MALVIRNWQADLDPVDTDGNNVVIMGRKEGVISYLLTMMGIDVTTIIKISPERVEYRASSLSGLEQRMIPTPSVCSTYYGYHKPWKQALAGFVSIVFFLLFPITSAIADSGPNNGGTAAAFLLVTTLITAAGAIIYYLLNKKMTLGFVENSGAVSGIIFKRSVIEGKGITQEQARRVCEIVQILIEAKTNR